MKRTSLYALAAAGLLVGGLPATGASAADLGGNCCADLEERIAELEATTARKGNRKVSLTISGWVAEEATFWDDGEESNIYVHSIGTTLSSHFKMTGQATIAPGWTAGYVIHVETNSGETFALNQDNDDGNGPGLGLLQSYWFINSERLGKVSVGLLSQASDNTAILVDGSGSLVPANWVIFDGASFFTLNNGVRTGNTWGQIGHCVHIGAGIAADCNGVPWNAVRYDTPTFAGFSASADWGEDDFWDVAARYAGEFGGFKVAVAAAYSHQSDDNARPLFKTRGGLDSDYFQIGAYAQHVATGIWVYGAYGHEDNGSVGVGAARVALNDGDMWYFKAGLRRRWHELGHTVLYGEYGQHDDMVDPALYVPAAITADSEFTRWGLGVVQEIDAAAMSIWLKYRHHEGDLTLGGAKTDFDDIHFVGVGALINF